jgi:hypothetical protein
MERLPIDFTLLIIFYAVKTAFYTSEDLKPHLAEVLDFKSLLVSYLKFESAVRI